MTQAEACRRLRALMAGCAPPKPTRPGYDKPDGREKLVLVYRTLRSVLPRRIAS